MRRLWRAARRRLHLTTPQPTILMYHRVAHVPRDPWELAVPPDLFDKQMRYLREHRTVLSMNALVKHLQADTLPQKAVAVTFDDAYRDNLLYAKPSLDRYGIPATLFVPTGLIGTATPMWWDELAAMILGSPRPESLNFTVAGKLRRWTWQDPEPGDARTAWRGWHAAVTARQSCFQQVWSALKPLPAGERAAALQRLRTQLPGEQDPLGHPMDLQELRLMQAGGLVTLAPHTVTHASLSALDAAACREEIVDSMRACALLETTPMQGFAYPYGDLNDTAAREVRDAGLTWACTTSTGKLGRGPVDLFRLPRSGATTISVVAFKTQLRT